MAHQEEQLVRMGEPVEASQLNTYNLLTKSSALKCVYRKSILGSL